MSISSLDTYKNLLRTSRDVNNFNIATITSVAGRPFDLWAAIVPTGTTPTSPVQLFSSSTGAIGQANAEGGLENFIIGARFSALNPGTYLICDRLSHQGGLSGNASGVLQTLNLPTAPLPRYTDGKGVMAGLTINTAVGTTLTSVSAEYTNELGVSARNTPLTGIGSTGFNNLRRFIFLPLQEGDFGVRSIESIRTTASTGTQGNIGVVLFKPLYVICVEAGSGVVSGGFITGFTSGGIPKIENDACLFLINISMFTSPLGSGALIIVES
jgi:hypothetical protein